MKGFNWRGLIQGLFVGVLVAQVALAGVGCVPKQLEGLLQKEVTRIVEKVVTATPEAAPAVTEATPELTEQPPEPTEQPPEPTATVAAPTPSIGGGTGTRHPHPRDGSKSATTDRHQHFGRATPSGRRRLGDLLPSLSDQGGRVGGQP